MSQVGSTMQCRIAGHLFLLLHAVWDLRKPCTRFGSQVGSMQADGNDIGFHYICVIKLDNHQITNLEREMQAELYVFYYSFSCQASSTETAFD
jgi:hypothetical protein